MPLPVTVSVALDPHLPDLQLCRRCGRIFCLSFASQRPPLQACPSVQVESSRHCWQCPDAHFVVLGALLVLLHWDTGIIQRGEAIAAITTKQ
jgi:hypothetical protein